MKVYVALVTTWNSADDGMSAKYSGSSTESAECALVVLKTNINIAAKRDGWEEGEADEFFAELTSSGESSEEHLLKTEIEVA
jgi:hypothetical protein